jgi:hypothetical protein
MDGESAFMENTIPSSPWLRIYKRSFLTENKLVFEIYIPEDVEFAYRSFVYMKRVKLVNDILYKHRYSPTSISRSPLYYKRFFDGFLEMIPKHIQFSMVRGGNLYWCRTFVNDMKDINIIIAKYISQIGYDDVIRNVQRGEKVSINRILSLNNKWNKYILILYIYKIFNRLIPYLFLMILKFKHRI